MEDNLNHVKLNTFREESNVTLSGISFENFIVRKLVKDVFVTIMVLKGKNYWVYRPYEETKPFLCNTYCF